MASDRNPAWVGWYRQGFTQRKEVYLGLWGSGNRDKVLAMTCVFRVLLWVSLTLSFFSLTSSLPALLLTGWPPGKDCCSFLTRASDGSGRDQEWLSLGESILKWNCPLWPEGRVTQDSSVCFWGLSQRRSGSHETGNYHTASTTEMKTPLFSCSVISDSLWPHGLQHTRLHYPSPSPRVCSSSCPLSWWCHPTISSSVVPFSSCPQSFPASGSFPMSQICASGGQSIGASASASALSMNTQGWFPLGLTGCISLQFKGLSRVFSSTIVWRHKFFDAQPFLLSSSYTYMNTGKTIALTIQTFVRKVISLLFNMLSKYLSLLFFQGASIF